MPKRRTTIGQNVERWSPATFSITTYSLTTLSMTLFSLMTMNMTRLRIRSLHITSLSRMTQLNDILHSNFGILTLSMTKLSLVTPIRMTFSIMSTYKAKQSVMLNQKKNNFDVENIIITNVSKVTLTSH